MEKKNLNLSCFEKFIGHNVFIQNEDADITYLYHNLSIDYDTYGDHLILIDGENECKTWIPLYLIRGITNLSDDLYVDVIEINAQYDWRIGCAEERLVPVKCDKCGHEFEEFEQIWSINQQGEYMSVYDGDWICKKLCDSCLTSFLGNNCANRIEESEYDELSCE